MKPALKSNSDIKNDTPAGIDFDDVSSSDGCLVPEQEEENDENNAKRFLDDLAKRETQRIRLFRVIVLVLIVASGAILSGLSYFFINKEQEENGKTKVSWIGTQREMGWLPENR